MRTFREDLPAATAAQAGGLWSNDDVIVTNRYGLRSVLAIAQPTGQFQLTSIPDSTPTYDRRGNLVSRVAPSNIPWKELYYTYDHENRLTCVQTDTYYTPESYRFNVEFVYDGQSRVRIKRNYIWSGGGWYGSGGETRYLYDLPAAAAAQAGGLLIVQERDGGNVPTVTYTRGRDLSGTIDGAGGIGGLLARSHGYSSGSWTYHNFYHSDGNGNVTALVNSGGTLQASYIYDPYGRYLTGTGTLVTSNVMRFSSKPWVSFLNSSATSGLYYYGYRFYDPYLQRWPNRDPMEELGGLNLYGFVGNSPVSSFDPDGRFAWVPVCCISCAGLAIWDVIDAIQDGTCAYGSASDRAACLLGKLVGNDLGGCVLEALWGVINGGSVNEAKDKIADCFKCEGWKAARDVAKALSCACCMGGLASKIPVPKPMPPPLPVPAAL